MEVNWTELLQNVLYAVITGVLPIVAYFIANAFKAWIAKKNVEISNEYARNTLSDVTDLITSAIINTSETFVKELKKTGKFDKEAAEEAFATTKDLILAQLSEEAKELIVEKYNDVDLYLRTQIESILPLTK